MLASLVRECRSMSDTMKAREGEDDLDRLSTGSPDPVDPPAAPATAPSAQPDGAPVSPHESKPSEPPTPSERSPLAESQ